MRRLYKVTLFLLFFLQSMAKATIYKSLTSCLELYTSTKWK